MRTITIRHVAVIAAAALAAAGLTHAAPAAGQAAGPAEIDTIEGIPTPASFTSRAGPTLPAGMTWDFLDPNPYDENGKDARAVLYVGSELPNYEARFQAYGEVLHVKDKLTDGKEAVVWAWYYASDGTIYDDIFMCGSRCSFQLGSSNDLAENNLFSFKICAGWQGPCTDRAHGGT